MTTTETAALALKLASAKKACLGYDPFNTGEPSHNECHLVPSGERGGNCQDGTGEVYVLDDSVRVECVGGPFFRVTVITREMVERHNRRGEGCNRCKGRGWNPLDSRHGWEWMMALAKAGFNLPMYSPNIWEPRWMCAIERADSPELAFFAAACKALELNIEE